jgi:hypothetical protein
MQMAEGVRPLQAVSRGSTDGSPLALDVYGAVGGSSHGIHGVGSPNVSDASPLPAF